MYVGDAHCPKVMQDGRDGDEEIGYIGNITDKATAGFKYFDCKGVKKVALTCRGYGNGTFEIKTAWDGPVLGTVTLQYTNVWERYETECNLPDGVNAIYLTYRDGGNVSLKSFELITE